MASFAAIDDIELSDEQELFLEYANQGYNVLVDACYGSGKTTAIQRLCKELSAKGFNILYLTYNRLLKADAKAKINLDNVVVQNYHGYVYGLLKQQGYPTGGQGDLMANYQKYRPEVDSISVLVIDEYQDIEESFTYVLNDLKKKNPELQIIAVGDMEQKIYDRTKLNAEDYIHEFMDNRPIKETTFTKSFRLCPEIAKPIGFAVSKKIRGVNTDGIAQKMKFSEIIRFLKQQDPGDVLILGSKKGTMCQILNKIEEECPEKFNKNTVYATIEDRDENILPDKNTMIVTTFDSAKGLEKPIVIVCDFSPRYWHARGMFADTNLKILRNIFCVAATRGKDRTIFLTPANGKFLPLEVLSKAENQAEDFPLLHISDMFEHKFVEDVDNAYNMLKLEKISPDDAKAIDINRRDGLIDLSPCIGIYQEAFYFDDYSIDTALDAAARKARRYVTNDVKASGIQSKILWTTSFETKQNRYVDQVKPPIVSEKDAKALKARLGTKLPSDAMVQKPCFITFNTTSKKNKPIQADGFCDVIHKGAVWELKFVSELQHTHFLQCACYMVALNKKTGYLWNTRTDELWKIQVPRPKKFMQTVFKTVTKGIYVESDLSGISYRPF